MMPPLELNFRRTPVTLILAAAIIALELVCSIDAWTVGERIRFLAYYNDYMGILPYMWEGQVWRPFTTTILHGSLLHAGFNVYWLVRFGGAIENRFGPAKTLGLVLLLGYTSMLPQYLMSNPDFVTLSRFVPDAWPTFLAEFIGPAGGLSPIVGFSGVNYGLFGILVIGRLRHRELDAVCDLGTVKFLMFWLVLCYPLTYTGMLPVANTAHLCGLLFGALYGLAIFDAKERPKWIALSVVATLAVLAILIPAPPVMVLVPV